MKIQCSCGVRHEIEIAPGTEQQPIQFVCPSCGLDSSAAVTQLVHSQLRSNLPEAPAPARPSGPIRVSVQKSPEPRAGIQESETCPRHGQTVVALCCICHRGICPACMEALGYVCSPLCKAKAQSHGITLPVYEGQRSVVQARYLKRVSRFLTTAVILAVLVGAFWFWYSWFGSEPKPVFAVRFPDPMLSGVSWQGGKDNTDLVFIHGATLARYDLAKKKELWRTALIDTKAIQARVDAQIRQMQGWASKARDEGMEDVPRLPPAEKLRLRLERAAMQSLELRVRGTNIWVFSPENITLYDWSSGRPVTELPARASSPVMQGDILLLPVSRDGKQLVARLDLRTGAVKEEPAPLSLRSSTPTPTLDPVRQYTNAIAEGQTDNLDPEKIARRAQSLPLPGRIALPAILAGAMNQQRLDRELSDHRPVRATHQSQPRAAILQTIFIPDGGGYLQFSTELLESRIIARSAMKTPPPKSALESGPGLANTVEISNELLNEMQRTRGGDKVYENQSRYRVTVKDNTDKPGWTGEIVGTPAIYPLGSVNVITGFKGITVLDKLHRKLFDGTLSYEVTAEIQSIDPEDPHYGQGPCVERDGRLYVFDAGMLTVFDLATGKSVWRLPSVGITAMFFDGVGNIYLNTTSAGPDALKYSKQIDIGSDVAAQVVKVDHRNGAVLWRAEPGGEVHYVSNQYIYTLQTYMPDPTDENLDGLPYVETGFEKPPYLKLKRLNPRNGRVMWEHFQQRAPLDARFDENTIRFVFKKEVQVLQFHSWF